MQVKNLKKERVSKARENQRNKRLNNKVRVILQGVPKLMIL